MALVVLGLSGCGSASSVSEGGTTNSTGTALSKAHPQAIQPTAGQSAQVAPADPIGDPHAHAVPLRQIKHELHLQLVAAPITNDTYVNPLQFVTVWERTDQGVDAQMPVGAPIAI